MRRRVRSQRRRAMLSEETLRREMLRDMKALAREMTAAFEDVVSDWANPPQFITAVTVKPDRISVVVRPRKRRKTSQIFEWVDKGTKGPYPIRPKRRRPRSNEKKSLAFRVGYQPRTLPVARGHAGSGQATGQMVFAKEVKHPGIRPRLFSETITDEMHVKFQRRANSTFRRLERTMNKRG
jgi:hypothetical protein